MNVTVERSKPIARIRLRFQERNTDGSVTLHQITLPVIAGLEAADLKVLWDFEQLINRITPTRLHAEMHDA